MDTARRRPPPLDPDILRYYAEGQERQRLAKRPFQLEQTRTGELLVVAERPAGSAKART